jgi:hypothetical protein
MEESVNDSLEATKLPCDEGPNLPQTTGPIRIRTWKELPDSFTDVDLCAALNHAPHLKLSHLFPLVCGLIIKLRSGYLRVYRRSENKFPRLSEEEFPTQFYDLVQQFTKETPKLLEEWSITDLWLVAEALTVKSINLSVPLQRELSIHPLYSLHSDQKLLQFHQDFLERVNAYHETLRRPEGTFEVPESEMIITLAELSRIRCTSCQGARQLYCGPCGGKRMENAENILPSRVELPFDIVLLLHW